MDDFGKLFSNEWGAPPERPKLEPTHGVEQGGNDTSVAAVLERDEERQIQGAGIIGYVKGTLDDDFSATEQGDEQAEEERVEEEATANQR